MMKVAFGGKVVSHLYLTHDTWAHDTALPMILPGSARFRISWLGLTRIGYARLGHCADSEWHRFSDDVRTGMKPRILVIIGT